MSWSPNSRELKFCTVVWLCCSVGALYGLTVHTSRAGAMDAAPSVWPATSKLPVSASFKSVVFVGGQCGCSRATLAEVGRLAAALGERCQWVIVLSPSADRSDQTLEESLAQLARAIPSAQVLIDHEGKEAASFHVRTSGEVLLYDHLGQLRFHGGITPARAHEGFGIGQVAICDWVLHHYSAISDCQVYGCPLVSVEKART